MRLFPRLALIFVIGIAGAEAVHLHADPRHVDPQAYLSHIKFLASDELEGRGDGMPGLEKAAEYIETRFRESGLQAVGDNGTFFQRFELVAGLSIDSGNAVTLTGPRKSVAFQIGRDYEVLSTSPDQTSRAPLPVVFAGYGISADKMQYDDYAGVDVAGKAVMIFTHEPQEDDPNSRFEGKINTTYSAIMNKVQTARAHGVRAVLLVDDPLHTVQTVQFRRWAREPQAEEYGIPVLYLSRDRVQEALGTEL